MKFKRGAFNFFLKENYQKVRSDLLSQNVDKSVPSSDVLKKAREIFKKLNEEELEVVEIFFKIRNTFLLKEKI
jgi:small-conductance mechanosensitive channel